MVKGNDKQSPVQVQGSEVQVVLLGKLLVDKLDRLLLVMLLGLLLERLQHLVMLLDLDLLLKKTLLLADQLQWDLLLLGKQLRMVLQLIQGRLDSIYVIVTADP